MTVRDCCVTLKRASCGVMGNRLRWVDHVLAASKRAKTDGNRMAAANLIFAQSFMRCSSSAAG